MSKQIMDNKKRIFFSLRDSLLWVLLTSSIGLVQIILYMMVSAFVSERTFDISVWIENGSIIAFSLALVSSIFFDTHFQKNHRKKNNKKSMHIIDKYFGGLFYKLLPWFVVLMVTSTTLISMFVESESLNKQSLINTQIAGVVLAYIYTFYFKYCSFYIGMRDDL